MTAELQQPAPLLVFYLPQAAGTDAVRTLAATGIPSATLSTPSTASISDTASTVDTADLGSCKPVAWRLKESFTEGAPTGTSNATGPAKQKPAKWRAQKMWTGPDNVKAAMEGKVTKKRPAKWRANQTLSLEAHAAAAAAKVATLPPWQPPPAPKDERDPSGRWARTVVFSDQQQQAAAPLLAQLNAQALAMLQAQTLAMQLGAVLKTQGATPKPQQLTEREGDESAAQMLKLLATGWGSQGAASQAGVGSSDEMTVDTDEGIESSGASEASMQPSDALQQLAEASNLQR